jgi:hypothetical protein
MGAQMRNVYVIPVRRKPMPDGSKGFIRITADGKYQRMGTFGHWYDISFVIYKILKEQGFTEADQFGRYE